MFIWPNGTIEAWLRLHEGKYISGHSIYGIIREVRLL